MAACAASAGSSAGMAPATIGCHVEAVGGDAETGVLMTRAWCRNGPPTFGHRDSRFSISALPGRQPVESTNGRCLISFNGEIYDFAELREELRLTPGPTTLAHRHRGPSSRLDPVGSETLPHLVGQWAFRPLRSTGEMSLAEPDRCGEEPLSITEAPSDLSGLGRCPL